jgi:hypothetical protein
VFGAERAADDEGKHAGEACVIVDTEAGPTAACGGMPLGSNTPGGHKLWFSTTPPLEKGNWVQVSESLWVIEKPGEHIPGI